MLSMKDVLKLRLGGFSDNMAMSGMMLSSIASNPLFGGFTLPGTTSSVAAGAAAGWYLGERWKDIVQVDAFDDTELKINSDEPPPVDFEDGVHLGYIVDSGKPLIIPMEEWLRHAIIVGQSGVGKTVLGEWVMAQQIMRGGGLLWIDGKLDATNIVKLRAMCAWAGRELDFLVVNPGDPDVSNSYNPVIKGDADEVGSRIMSIVPASEQSPGSDYFRQASNQALTTLISALQATDTPGYNFIDLTILLMNPKALESLLDRIPRVREEYNILALFMESLKAPNKQGVQTLDMKKMKDLFGGIGGRLFTFGTGKVGKVTSAYNPEVDMFEAVMKRKVVYMALPTMGKSEMASNFGKLAIGDFKSAIAQVQGLPEDQRPKIPFLGFFDEAGSFVTNSWSRMFEQSRSARLVMCPAVQTKANFAVLGEELLAMSAGNTQTKIFFKPGEPETATWMEDMIGEERQLTSTVSTSQNDSLSAASIADGKNMSSGLGSGIGVSEKVDTGAKISAADLKKLGRGEAIVLYDGSKVYHIKVPRLVFDKKFLAEIEAGGLITNFDERWLKSQRGGLVSGLDLYSDIDRWLSSDQIASDQNYTKKQRTKQDTPTEPVFMPDV